MMITGCRAGDKQTLDVKHENLTIFFGNDTDI